MKIILGGVPFGCDNIGDEAILECIVKILRRNFNGVEITVATRKPAETAVLLGVNAVPLYGFDVPADSPEVADTFSKNDIFIWAGATGLSDYPDTTLPLLKLAKSKGLKTILWGVGMDDTLNPAFFKLGGKKLMVCKLLSALTFNLFDAAAFCENRLQKSARKRVAKSLMDCDAIVVRDPQTKIELQKCSPTLEVIVGADSAIELEKSDLRKADCLDARLREELLSDSVKIGVCISAQRRVEALSDLAECLDEILSKGDRDIIFIPMNPVTDSVLMLKIKAQMKYPEKTFMLENCQSPAVVQAVANRCDVVVSSRLHLLILSANVSTPIVGISRGSKLDNFLKPFSLKCACGVADFNKTKICKNIEAFIKSGKKDFRNTRDLVYADLRERLSYAESILRKIVQI